MTRAPRTRTISPPGPAAPLQRDSSRDVSPGPNRDSTGPGAHGGLRRGAGRRPRAEVAATVPVHLRVTGAVAADLAELSAPGETRADVARVALERELARRRDLLEQLRVEPLGDRYRVSHGGWSMLVAVRCERPGSPSSERIVEVRAGDYPSAWVEHAVALRVISVWESHMSNQESP